jgi:hypothetical protein
MGDHTLLTGRISDATIIVKADKAFNRRQGEPIGVDFAGSAVHLFDKASGNRLAG